MVPAIETRLPLSTNQVDAILKSRGLACFRGQLTTVNTNARSRLCFELPVEAIDTRTELNCHPCNGFH